MQDPAAFLPDLVTDLECAVEPSVRARVDAAHCVQLNFETYFVSSDDARTRFRAEPLRFCGKLTDPVTQLRFRPDAGSPHLEWKGKSFYFSSDSTRALFAALPDSFSVPRIGMLAMEMGRM